MEKSKIMFTVIITVCKNVINRVVLQKISSLVIFATLTKIIKVAYVDNPFKWRHFQPEIILLTVRWS